MTERNLSGREPFEALELDQDFCGLEYGIGECTATLGEGGRKCFNTRKTCQDSANYDRQSKTLFFCSNRVQMPSDGNYWLPFLRSVRIRPSSINPGGGNGSKSALGTRATITAVFEDNPHSDNYVDPYVEERKQNDPGYIPLNQGTFWSKWRARNPFYLNRVLRYRSGYIKDGQIVDEVVRVFVVTGFSGPSSDGTVTIQGKDILTLIQDKKAKAPIASNGKLSSDIDLSQLTFQISPAGIGDSDYPSSGTVRINNEVMTYSRAGDTFTVLRATDGTDPDEHEEGDTVQLCLRYTGESVPSILQNLLEQYANVPVQYLNLAQWESERLAQLPRLYSAIITEPTGVDKLVAEMSEQMFFYPWFDERSGLVNIQAIRPPDGEEIYQLNDSFHLLENSVQVQDKPDELLTRVVVNYGLRDPTQKLNEVSNYGATDLIVAPDAESDDQNQGSRTKTINSRWITGTNGAAAIELADRILARYSSMPQTVSFSLDAKDRDVWVGSFAQITDRKTVDDTGQPVPLSVQVLTASEQQLGTTFSYKAQTYSAEYVPPTEGKQIIISQDSYNVNIRELYDEQIGVAPQAGETITVVIRSNVKIGGRIKDLWAADRDGFISDILVDPFSVSGPTVGGQATILPMYQDEMDSSKWGALVETNLPGDQVRYNSAGDTLPLLCEQRIFGTPVSLYSGEWPEGIDKISLVIEPGALVIGGAGYGGIVTAADYLTATTNKFTYATFASCGGHALATSVNMEIDNQGTIETGGFGGSGMIAWTEGEVQSIMTGGGGKGFGGGLALNFQQIGSFNPSDPFPVTQAVTQQPASGNDIGRGQGGKWSTFRPTFGGGFSAKDFLSRPGGFGASSGTSSGIDWDELDEGLGPALYDYFVASYFENVSGRPLLRGAGRNGFAVWQGKDLITYINKGNFIGGELN